ncbi:hypothetical protein MATL_G00139020 [Megalops atlanticus]|uniref:Uncharacterized protein n=1 Tax=Megalops atlanticus TaxID=7932 RepID=A0A9D3PXP7_MEGAT|nr:hypothetical protein MATL_G00139020 [Megalops atlanticus]
MRVNQSQTPVGRWKRGRLVLHRASRDTVRMPEQLPDSLTPVAGICSLRAAETADVAKPQRVEQAAHSQLFPHAALAAEGHCSRQRLEMKGQVLLPTRASLSGSRVHDRIVPGCGFRWH